MDAVQLIASLCAAYNEYGKPDDLNQFQFAIKEANDILETTHVTVSSDNYMGRWTFKVIAYEQNKIAHAYVYGMFKYGREPIEYISGRDWVISDISADDLRITALVEFMAEFFNRLLNGGVDES